MTITNSPRTSTERTSAPGRVRTWVAARIETTPAWVLFIRLFIGLGWLRAVAEKVIDPRWWDGTEVIAFIDGYSLLSLGWYRPVVDQLVAPNAGLFAVVLVLAQLVAAITLLSGRYLGYGVSIGIFMNLNFLVAGAVDPSVFYLLSQGALAFWIAEQTTVRKLTSRMLSTIAIGAYVLALMSLPSITTFHPARVIADPAIMFVVMALVTIVACDQAHRRITGGRGLPALDWLLRRQVAEITVDTDDEVLVIR